MAVKDWFLANALVDGWQQLSESVQTAASITGGWIVGSTAPGSLIYSEFESGVERLESTFAATVWPDGVLNATLKDALRTPLLHGYFASANFVFHGVVRAITNGGSQDGRVRVRIIVANADGSNAREITSAVQNGTTVLNVSTSADFDSDVTIAVNGFAVENQYLFFQIAWERTGAGGMTTADIAFRTGSSSTVGTRITSPDFTPQAGTGARQLKGVTAVELQRLTTTLIPSTVTDNFTVRVIAIRRSADTFSTIMRTGVGGASPTGVAVAFGGAGGNTLLNPRNADSDFALAQNTWYDIHIRMSAGTADVFVNGVKSVAGAGALTVVAAATVFSIGTEMDDATTPKNGATLFGDIAEVALWERALTDAEISDLYNSGIFKRSNEISTANLVRRWALGMGDTQESDEVGAHLLTHTKSPLVTAGPTFFGGRIPRLMTMGIG